MASIRERNLAYRFSKSIENISHNRYKHWQILSHLTDSLSFIVSEIPPNGVSCEIVSTLYTVIVSLIITTTGGRAFHGAWQCCFSTKSVASVTVFIFSRC